MDYVKMKKQDRWILKSDCIKMNGISYWFKCVFAQDRKFPNDTSPSIQLSFLIYKEGVGWIDWEEFKGSYLAEKLTDYVKNSINGQRSIYWDHNRKRNFKG